MAWYDQNEGTVERRYDDYSIAGESSSTSFMHLVYQHMALGLLLTGLVAGHAARTPELFAIARQNSWLLFGGQIALVFALSALVTRLNAAVAGLMFYAYSALMGLSLSVIFYIYTRQSIELAFFSTGGTFAAMSVYGYVTKRDLTSVGNFMFMGLIGLVIASIGNIFLNSPMISWITTYIGVIIFVGLTAYDTQKIKRMADQVEGHPNRGALGILGALTLYLDFINLFIYLLRILGDRRRN